MGLKDIKKKIEIERKIYDIRLQQRIFQLTIEQKLENLAFRIEKHSKKYENNNSRPQMDFNSQKRKN